MSRKHRVRNLERSVRALGEPAAVPATASPAEEGGELARELVRALTRDLEQYRRRGLAAERPDPAQPPPDWHLQGLLAMPPEDVSFSDIERLTHADPDRAAGRWAEVKAVARRGLANGWLAGRALEARGGSAWERAVFLAVRDRLHRAWPPRHDGEAQLLDEMAQYEVLRQKWLGVFALHSGPPAALPDRRGRGEGEERRLLSAAEAAAEAVRMVERLQRLFQAALRALLAQRRPRGPVFVRGSGPVNVAVGRQVNVAAPAGPRRVFDAPPGACDNASPPAATAEEGSSP